MSKAIIAALAMVLAGCGDISLPDQCLRVQLFSQCMSQLPTGPVSTQYNDWDEVVQACNSVAHSQSIRPIPNIKPECRP